MGLRESLQYLEKQAGSNLRGVAQYDREATDVPYLRDDINDIRMISHVDRKLRRLRSESPSSEATAFPFGGLHATPPDLRRGHHPALPTRSDRGLVVSVVPETATQLNTFVSGCLDQLGRQAGRRNPASMRSPSPNKCQAARYLAADGYSARKIADAIDAHDTVVGRHLREEYNCPDLNEPRIVPPVDGDELRTARKAARLTQIELGEIVDTNNGTVSGLEHEKVDTSPPLRYRIHEWFDRQENE